MTRINVIAVSELSDQHLIAEYHELPIVVLTGTPSELAEVLK